MTEEIKPENTDYILLTYKDEFDKIVSTMHNRDLAPALNLYKYKRTKQYPKMRVDEWVHLDIFDTYE